jgi:uncharacterized membrane protein
MSTATDTITVDVPVTTAYNQWTQMESYPKFMVGVQDVEQLDDTHLRWHMNVAGVERDFDVVITDQVPDRLIAWESHGELEQRGRVDFTPMGSDATQVTLSLDWNPTGATEKIGSAFMVDEALVARNLGMFKEFIEGRGLEEGAWRGEVMGGATTGSTQNPDAQTPLEGSAYPEEGFLPGSETRRNTA